MYEETTTNSRTLEKSFLNGILFHELCLKVESQYAYNAAKCFVNTSKHYIEGPSGQVKVAQVVKGTSLCRRARSGHQQAPHQQSSINQTLFFSQLTAIDVSRSSMLWYYNYTSNEAILSGEKDVLEGCMSRILHKSQAKHTLVFLITFRTSSDIIVHQNKVGLKHRIVWWEFVAGKCT